MEKDPFYTFIAKTYSIHPIMLAAALYALGGVPYIVWGMVISQMPRVSCTVVLCVPYETIQDFLYSIWILLHDRYRIV